MSCTRTPSSAPRTSFPDKGSRSLGQVAGLRVAHHLPIKSTGAVSTGGRGGVDATAGERVLELRAYLGTDPESGKHRYATRTVRGTKRAAHQALVELVEDASHGRRAGARSTSRACWASGSRRPHRAGRGDQDAADILVALLREA